MSGVGVDWDAMMDLVAELPSGTTFWRGIGHSPRSLGEGDTLRAFSWLSTVRSEASGYARLPRDKPVGDGPWMCEYVNDRPLRILMCVSCEGAPVDVTCGMNLAQLHHPDFLAGLASLEVDLLLVGHRGFDGSRLGYVDHVRPLRTGILNLVTAHVTDGDIEHGLFLEALRNVDPDGTDAIGNAHPSP